MLKRNNKLKLYYPVGSGYKKYARLHLRKSFTNFFLTLTDLYDRVICTVSTGRVCGNNNKRIKRSPITLSKMLLILRKAFVANKLKKVEIVLKTKISSELNSIVRQLTGFGIRILKISDFRIHAHNGVRGRRIRRT